MSEDLYKKAGVDVEAADKLVEWLQTSKSGSSVLDRFGKVVSGIGGFAGLFELNLPESGIKNPVLVASTDGVGTKVLLGVQHQKLEGLGQDLVAMCINDLYTVGARPLFFLDYYATSFLQEHEFKSVLLGIKTALNTCNCALLGGETAELPGMYKKGEFDLAGFVVGIADKSKILSKERVRIGDDVIAIASNGFHSNGFSLIRKMLDERKQKHEQAELIDRLLQPTALYNFVPDLCDKFDASIHGIANITGGGISGNLPRVIPNSMYAQIERKKLHIPNWMADFMGLKDANFFEFEKVFNMGIGMMMVVDPKDSDEILKWIAKVASLQAYRCGSILSGSKAEGVEYV